LDNFKVEVNKVYKINDQEFVSKEEAVKNIAINHLKEIVDLGVDEAIKKSEDFIKNIKQIVTVKRYGHVGKNLKALNLLLYKEEGHIIFRDNIDYFKYYISNDSNLTYQIRFKGTVSEMISIYEEQGLPGLLKFEIK
jgi:hypothetical protein